jgi:hypothetical protein
MNATMRGPVLLVALLLWSPVLPGLIDGAREIGDAALLFAGALLLAWAGVAALHGIVRAYSSQAEPAAQGQDGLTQARRRSDDASAAPDGPTAADAG